MYRLALLLTPALLLPIAVRAEEHIVDDQHGAPGFTTTGNDWATWGTNGYGYTGADSSYHYLSHTVGGDDRKGTATWQAELGQAGLWRIETWFRRTENRTTDADHVVTDGLGSQTRTVINQEGEGASGWVSLGEYWCEAGFGGCLVTLDGTDDNGSDAANAMRFTFVTVDDNPVESDPCDDSPEVGTHVMEVVAQSASGNDWQSASKASGDADGQEAHSANVDAGEVLRATGFNVCDPEGEETIDRVVLSVRARTQYDSGTYALRLRLDAGGAPSTVFTGTSPAWHDLDLSTDEAWTWSSLAGLTGQVSLHDHPGGARDSDAWVDSFRLSITYSTLADGGEDTAEPDTGEPEENRPQDTGALDTSEPQTPDSHYAHLGCGVVGAMPTGWIGLALIALIPCRRRLDEAMDSNPTGDTSQ